MSESEYNKEVSDVIKDPYSIDFNNLGFNNLVYPQVVRTRIKQFIQYL